MQSIHINQATANDLDLLVDMRILFGDELVGKQDPTVESDYRNSLRQYFAAELDQTYLSCYATVDGIAVAIAGMVVRKQPGSLKNPSGLWEYIMNVFTLPAYGGRALSTQVMRALMEYAATRGITAFELHATEQGEPVYQKLGFKIHPEPTYRMFIG